MGHFIFNGKSSNDFSLSVQRYPNYNAPAKVVESISVPGRSGALKISTGAFENVPRKYDCFFKGDSNTARAIKMWLLSNSGYARLEDSYDTTVYRMAQFEGPADIEAIRNRFGRLVISFDCKPQLFLKSGEDVLTFTAANVVYNPTEFTALPLIRVYGTAPSTLTVGNTIVQINAINEYVDLDCELQDAFKGISNCNGNIYAPDFPKLPPGGTGISFSGGITKIEIKPRWWTV